MQNFNYKFYDLPNLEIIQGKIWNNIPVEVKNKQAYMSVDKKQLAKCKELVEGFNSFHDWNDIHDIGLIIVQPKSHHDIHTDSGLLLRHYPYAFNIPIQNTENTWTVFYKLKEGKSGQLVLQPHGDPYYIYSDTDVEEIERFNCTKPCFLNTQQPHQVINGREEIRALISIRCRKPFDFDKIFPERDRETVSRESHKL